MSKLELLRKLEHLITFQKDCLDRGDWDTFDKVENEIKRIEESILKFKN